MQELKKKKLNYLTEEEIIDFYELFFGNILIKKPGISYYSNLSKCLDKESFVQGVLNRLNESEYNVLKILSKSIFIPYNFLVDKLNIILNLSNQVINKALTNLIEKKYIFLRDEETLVVADVYFSEEKDKVNYSILEDEKLNLIQINSRALSDINNLINYFISKEIKFSNSFAVYKKDMVVLKSIFSKYSTFAEKEYNLIAYFFSLAFLGENGTIQFESVKNYFGLTPVNKIMFFIKTVFPWIYSILKYFYDIKKAVQVSLDEFEKLWYSTFLITEYDMPPIKYNLESTLKLLEKLGLIKIRKKDIYIPIFSEEYNQAKDDVRLSSSFNFFINADSARPDFFMPALFADFVKYNKITEYEITELSIKRGIANGVVIDEVLDYFNSLSVNISKNVEAVIKQWFDKYGSYYYAVGTFFFCKNADKGKLINTLIKKGMIKGFEIKKDEIFLVKDEDKENFFGFLEKSDMNYYKKTPRELFKTKKEKALDVKKLFNSPDVLMKDEE